MKRILCLFFVALVFAAVPALHTVIADLFSSDGGSGVIMLAIVFPGINLTGVQELFRPQRIAQVINATEAYGTPVMDLFYPESRRQA